MTEPLPLRIAVVTAHRHLVGGLETYLRWLLEALVRRGHAVAFAHELAATDPERVVDRPGVRLVRWDVAALGRRAFLGELERFGPDLVFSQGAHDERLDAELAARHKTLLFAHGFYGTCVTGWRLHRRPGLEVCTRRMGLGCLPTNYLRGCGGRDPIRLGGLYRQQVRRREVVDAVAGLVVASRYMQSVFVDHGVAAERVHVIAPPAEFEADPEPPARRPQRGAILFLGRLTSGKGGADAVRAVAFAERELGRSLELTMAGEGPELERCRALAREMGVRAHFPGWVDGARRVALLREADVLIMPSLWPEPFGMVGVEAGSVGVPAVAYRTGGIPDWLRPGETGELAQGSGFEPKALGAALARVLASAEHHHSLAVGAWKMARELSGARHLERLEAVFRALVTETRAG